ncbi:MAG TPA: serine/threonine-protein kinase [Luteolibacter sp.]|nr:serine/threonine-protein kinase [Luteolibacter sp.]
MSLEAEPFTAPAIEELASLFPGYAIDSLIACGGMGAVYHGRQVALDREVAIKVLPREFSNDASFRDGFAAEARAMAKLNHPNLIGVYDFGEVDGMLYIIMEFVPGQSLYHAAYQTAVEQKEAARLMSEICSGLAEAHHHGILHRDIKPANILLDAHNRPKIGDFGLARPIGTAEQEGEVIYGTPHYTAPEVLNNPRGVDARADVFSLGVVLHELLTSKLPANDPRPPSAICGCSPKFDAIVKRATNPVTALRYPDAAAMERDLKELAAVPAYAAAARAGMHRPPEVRRPRASQTVVKTSGGSGAFGWLLLLALLGGGGYYYYTHHYKKPAPAPAPVEEPQSRLEVKDFIPPKKTEPEPKPDLAPLPGETSGNTGGGGSKIFDTPTAPLGTPVPVRETVGPKPIFAVEPFLERARNIMASKSDGSIRTRQSKLSSNIDTFEREVSRATRKEGPEASAAGAVAIKAIRENRNRIPDVFAIEGVSDTVYTEAYSAAIKRQEAADTEYFGSLQSQAALYMHGLQMQIERLENDPGAVELLINEIRTTREDPTHFGNVIDPSKK